MSLELFSDVTEDLLTKEVKLYERHLRGDHDYVLDVEPVPTPRPRGRAMKSKYSDKHFVHFYNEPHYTKYKTTIAWMLRDAKLGLKPGDYSKIFVTFYLPYPKSTSKKNLIENAPHRKKPDWDNYIKGIQDAMEEAGIFINDGALSDGIVMKRYTTRERGYIAFSLF